MGAAVGVEVGVAVGASVGAVVVALVEAGVGATVELPEAGGVGAMVGAMLWVRGGGEDLVLLLSSIDASCVCMVVWRGRGRVWMGRMWFVGVRCERCSSRGMHFEKGGRKEGTELKS